MWAGIREAALGYEGFRKALKISCDQWELNVYLTETDLTALKSARPGPWADRKSVKAGTTARAPVFWSMEDGKLTLLIGDDDETWDVAFTLPEIALAQILKAV